MQVAKKEKQDKIQVIQKEVELLKKKVKELEKNDEFDFDEENANEPNRSRQPSKVVG